MRILHLAASTCLSISIAAVSARAQAPGGGELLTLDRAIELALASNREVQIAGLDERRAEDDLASLQTRRRPIFDLKALEGGFLSPVQFSFRQGAFGTFPATGPIPLADLSVDSPRQLSTAVLFTAVQPITQLRKIARGAALIKLGGSLAAEKTRERRQAVVADVRRTYYGLQQARTGLAALGEALAQIEELDRVVGQYVAQEAALPADHMAVRAGRAKAERDRLVLRNLQATLSEKMNLLLGRDLATPFTIAEAPPAPPVDATIEQVVARAVAARPAIRQAELNVQRAEGDLHLKAMDRLPDVSLGVAYLRLFNVDVLPRNVAAASVVLTWQPFDWGRTRYETRARAETLEQARLGMLHARSLTELDVRARYRGLVEAQETLRYTALARETAVERLRVATDRYRAEASLLKDVLAAQTALAEATQAHQQALGTFWSARAELDQAIGDQP